MSELLKLANQLTDRASKHQDAAEAIPDNAGAVALSERDKHIAQARVCLDIAKMATAIVTARPTTDVSQGLMPTEEMIEAVEAEARSVEGDSDNPLRVAAANELWDKAAAMRKAMEAARPTTDASTDGLVERLDPRASILAIIRANRHAGESQEVLARDLTTLFRAMSEALQRSNAEKDELLREAYKALFGAGCGHSPLTNRIFEALSHSSETNND